MPCWSLAQPCFTPALCLIDVDECLNTCLFNSHCINTPGSYFCTCHPGFAQTFRGQGLECMGEHRACGAVWEASSSLLPQLLDGPELLQMLMNAPGTCRRVVPMQSAPTPWALTAAAAPRAFVPIQKAPRDLGTSAANVMTSLGVVAMGSVLLGL